MYRAILRAHQEKASELIITLVCIIVIILYQEFIKITIIIIKDFACINVQVFI